MSDNLTSKARASTLTKAAARLLRQPMLGGPHYAIVCSRPPADG
jgi:hypothetical protein